MRTHPRRAGIRCAGAALASVVLGLAGSLGAQPPAAAVAPSRAEIGAFLASDDPTQTLAAMTAIREGSLRGYVPRIATLLRDGQPDAVTHRGLETLGALRSTAAAAVLSEFARHRRPAVRRRAYRALAQTPGPRADQLLEAGLRDSDRQVRGVAATALGNRGNRAAVDTLFIAFERGVVEAAAALGKLGDGSTLERFNQQLGTLALPVMLSGYREFLQRRNVRTEAKRNIVILLGEVSGPVVQRFLREYLATLPTRPQSRFRTLVEDTLRRVVADPSRTTRPTRPARLSR